MRYDTLPNALKELNGVLTLSFKLCATFRFEHSFSRDTDNPTCALLVSRDISARRAQRAAEIKMAGAQLAARQQAEMAAFLFHELRNDQHAVAGILELVVNQTEFKQNDEEVPFDTDTRNLLHQARTHAEHASQVISNMLEFTKLRAGELTLPTDIPFDLHTVCEEARAARDDHWEDDAVDEREARARH